MQQQFFNAADGVRLAADIGGDVGAPPVVLMHGAGQTRYSWKSTLQALITVGYYVVSLDTRGHGDSDWAPNGAYNMALFTDDLSAVLNRLTAPPAIVGASLGGLTALSAVGTHKVTARALVLVDITPKMNPDGAKKIRLFMRAAPNGFASVEEAADSVAAYMPQRARPKNIEGLRRNLRTDAQGRLHWHWDPAFMPPADALTLNQDIELQFSNAARQVAIPTLLVRGSRSEVVDDESVAHFRKLIPHAEFMDVMGAGHMVAGDSNSTFNAGIIDFLQRNFPA